MAHPQVDLRPANRESPAYFGDALEDAERLLKHAAETGISVDDAARDQILQARAAGVNDWSQETAANLLAALQNLAAALKPVTAASLKACANRPTVRKYWIVSICLAAVIIPVSVLSFVTSAISNTIKANIAAANDLVVKLRTQVGPVPNPVYVAGGSPVADTTVITELQQFATDIREIDAGARQLRWLVPNWEPLPFAEIRGKPMLLQQKFQLPDPLTDFAKAAGERISVYQVVRYFGQCLVDDVSVYYGAVTACILPVLYALLGTSAYLLRMFELQIAARTYTPSVADTARFLIAGIGGAVVGLFNNFAMGQGASIPPLAIAFLVGYAVDVFFSFLEGLVQKFTRGGAPGNATPGAA